MPSLLSEDDEDGEWIWDGVQEESEVEPIDQDSYDSDHTGHTFVVRDHRTEGELHINKRDLELYEQDMEDSYGKAREMQRWKAPFTDFMRLRTSSIRMGRRARSFPRENWSPLPQRIKTAMPLSW